MMTEWTNTQAKPCINNTTVVRYTILNNQSRSGHRGLHQISKLSQLSYNNILKKYQKLPIFASIIGDFSHTCQRTPLM